MADKQKLDLGTCEGDTNTADFTYRFANAPANKCRENTFERFIYFQLEFGFSKLKLVTIVFALLTMVGCIEGVEEEALEGAVGSACQVC